MKAESHRTVFQAFAVTLYSLILTIPVFGQTDERDVRPGICTVDLSRAGMMKDIVSNALTVGLNHCEAEVNQFLRGAENRFASGAELLSAAAKQFKLPEDDLRRKVERFRHCNCVHGPLSGVDAVAIAPPHDGGLSQFASDVTLHVVLHELGHALVREFDLPVLGNEETMADAFATHYLTHHLPGHAARSLTARIRSLMIEAKEVPRAEWSVRGEHDNDARRAWQIAALAIAADPGKYGSLGSLVRMAPADRAKCIDYGAEIHRSWRRILRPVIMPAGLASKEVRVRCDTGSGLLSEIKASALPKILKTAMRRFDWHSQVTLRFAAGGRGAGWSRSKRTITVASEYVRRFVAQGRSVERAKKEPK